jgi:hypothetical protein
MINIAELTSSMQVLMNDNVLSTKFKVFYWINNLDYRIEDFGNGNEDYIPVVIINTSGQYRPIPDTSISDQSFTLQIYYPYSRQNEVLSNIEQFSSKIIGKTILIDGKRCVFNMDVPNLSEVKQEHIGILKNSDPRLRLKETEYYGVLQLRLYFVESTFLYGNDIKYSLKVRGASTYENVVRYDSSIFNTKIVASDQMLSQPTSESIVQMNSFTNQLTLYFNSSSALHQSIVRNAELGLNQTQVYTLKIEYANISNLSFEKDVIIENVSISQTLGNIITLSITFKKASVIL